MNAGKGFRAGAVLVVSMLAADPTWDDASVEKGHRYTYTVRAYDHAGNESAPSPQAVGDPF